jgi:arylformamidase
MAVEATEGHDQMIQPSDGVADLTQELFNGMSHAASLPSPAFRTLYTVEEHGLRVTEMTLVTHMGTHLDAPSHFIPDGATIERLPISTLLGPAVCVPVHNAPNEPVSRDQLEAACHQARAGDALLIRTGWDDRYGSDDYLDHPYLSDEAARWIVERGFRLVGVDTPTPDLPGPLREPGFPFPVHKILLGAGVLILENLVLREVVGQRFSLFIGALRVRGGDGAPARVLAIPSDE